LTLNFDGPDGGYPEESDPGPYPFDAQTRIEGGPDSTGDRHALMIDRDDSLDGGPGSDACLHDARERSIRDCP
jgi:hypothetical protein